HTQYMHCHRTRHSIRLVMEKPQKYDFMFGPNLRSKSVSTAMSQCQTYMHFSKIWSHTAVLTDSRIHTMNEVVSGIRIIKMYAWEKPFAALVSDIRRKEISKIMKSSYLKIIVFVTFTLYVLLGNKISASRVFVTVSLCTAVRLTVTLFFPNAIEKLFESRVGIRRIQEFLLLGQITKSSANLPKDEKKDAGVEVQDLTCYWDKSLDAPSLQNVSFSLKSNQPVAVIGPVGAGKSSLLSSILGELPAEKGVLKVKGQLTYAAQQPWVFPRSIRSNILFGKELNPQKYERTIRACALKRDLQLLPDGDQMLIGDRGATLSGGQKARVNLARAVYQDADIYLLDDPLSAVDAEVGRHLFEQCICGLLKNKPRILVTHQLQYLKAADQIVVLKEGHMVAKGTYTELQQSGVDFTSLLKKDEEDEQQQPAQDIPARSRTLSQNSVLSQTSSVQSVMDGDSLLVEPVQTLAEESRAQGTIGVRLYVKYLRAGASIVTLLAAIVLNLLAQGAYIMQDWWLAYWADEQEKLDALNTTITNAQNATQELDRDFYLGIYAGLTGATIIFGFMRNLVLFNVLVRCAQSLHNGMFNTILRTPVRFFDVNPIGRILNRFSKDIGQLDSNMPWTFVESQAIQVDIFIYVRVCVCVCVCVCIYIYICVSRSPVFSHLSSSLQGLWTIRAFGAEERFQNTFDAHQDLHSEAWFLFLTTSHWFAVRLDFICAVFVTITTFGCVLLRDQLDAGSVGLALSYAVTLTGMFQWGVRQSAEVENMTTQSLFVTESLRRFLQVQLKSAVEELPGKLETVLAESGSNFSVGQRQLVCLARAILRKNRILIIDEATANVDPRTDELIQKTIRDKFRECTVDRILVLDAGEIHAYDEPYSLLQDPNGTFYKMVQQTGKQEAAALQSAAEQVYSNRSRANVPNGHAETADGNIVIFETAL
uniref:ATP-binding cassette, sub-family C (CFTR/MRP), member 4 n=1 Tax=Amphiprion ocellaris TaxID=80972 RepID=A0A3Q1C633_AMPOC